LPSLLPEPSPAFAGARAAHKRVALPKGRQRTVVLNFDTNKSTAGSEREPLNVGYAAARFPVLHRSRKRLEVTSAPSAKDVMSPYWRVKKWRGWGSESYGSFRSERAYS